ncbi:hypothetical protein MCSF7_02846 [Mycoplasmopsis columbina SF7]|uniref:Uncharacterized protein n=1 Tax=Mycoplasmopsis columbina SF7 TaxID=1037410 RepID=F9UJB1_9BACT|nr:hypothetical protein MCSF7_02846 [Mycoplasmopsis columbina SF7]
MFYFFKKIFFSSNIKSLFLENEKTTTKKININWKNDPKIIPKFFLWNTENQKKTKLELSNIAKNTIIEKLIQFQLP